MPACKSHEVNLDESQSLVSLQYNQRMSFKYPTLAFCLQLLVKMNFRPIKKKSVNPVCKLNGGCRESVGTGYPLDCQIYGFLPLPHAENIAVLSDTKKLTHIALHPPSCTCNLSAGQIRIPRKMTCSESPTVSADIV